MTVMLKNIKTYLQVPTRYKKKKNRPCGNSRITKSNQMNNLTIFYIIIVTFCILL